MFGIFVFEKNDRNLSKIVSKKKVICFVSWLIHEMTNCSSYIAYRMNVLELLFFNLYVHNETMEQPFNHERPILTWHILTDTSPGSSVLELMLFFLFIFTELSLLYHFILAVAVCTCKNNKNWPFWLLSKVPLL